MWGQAKLALDDSTARLLNQFAGFLPGLLALFVALLVSVAVASLLAVLLRWTLRAIRFDERLTAWGWPELADWAPGNSPSMLVSRLVWWTIIVIGFLVGISALDTSLTFDLVHSTITYLPNVLGAALVLLIGTIVARFLGRSVLIGAVNINLQYARLLSIGVKWMVIVLAVAMALEHLRIAPGIVQLAFGILFGGIVLALALAVGLGARELVSRSLETEMSKPTTETVEEPFRHL